MRGTYFLFFCLLFVANSAVAQLSAGGFPMQLNELKSSKKVRKELPRFEQSQLRAIMQANRMESNVLKPFRFAHAFQLDLNSENAGEWYTSDSSYNVWKLTLSSKGAQSLNVIFDDFQLVRGARLFLYNEKESYYLGAYTSQNNKSSQKFAVAPVSGDELTIQYEVPKQYGRPNNFTIERVNHDFIGILKFDRRPYYGQVAGTCNVDVNCDLGARWDELKNSVCRLIVDGDEICTGTLINNTAENETPYVLSASHCYDKWEFAETTVYTFNYESPYCAPLDGDPRHSLSGAVMKAHFDSLDFALVELDELPPPHFRPYFAGWDRNSGLPDSSVSIHHPKGDIKKIAFDNDEARYATFTSNSINNPENGSFRILSWDDGVTEIGSSGGALFNMRQQVIGTLSGGAATCANPVNDFFARFSMQWDYHSDTTKQLKHWLDPINSGDLSLSGRNFNREENLCNAFTNLNDMDDHANVVLTSGGQDRGYWGGTNNEGISEFVERFSIAGYKTLEGISLGIGKLELKANSKSAIRLTVYNGNDLPENEIYSQVVGLNGFVEGVMNFVPFDEVVEPGDNFFLGFELSNMEAGDTLVLYQSLRQSRQSANSFYFKQNGTWYDFKDANPQEYGMANVVELLACHLDENTDPPFPEVPVKVWVYPNPTSSVLNLESDKTIDEESISVFNMLGQEVGITLVAKDPYRYQLRIKGQTPGIYFVRFNYAQSTVTRKISFVPY